MRKAIVTLAIGFCYEKIFDDLCRLNWQKYCEKYGYDLIVLRHPLDDSERARRRPPAWQKLLILSQQWSNKYDQMVWIDTDIFINNSAAPDIVKHIPIEKVAGVEAYSIPTKHIYEVGLRRSYDNWKRLCIPFMENMNPRDYYNNRNIKSDVQIDKVFQSGVFVCSPKYHKDIFEHIYYSYENKFGPEYNYEMPAFSFEIIKNDFQYWIEPYFNMTVGELEAAFYSFIFNVPKSSLKIFFGRGINKVKKTLFGKDFLGQNKIQALSSIFDISYFMHFAGCSSQMNSFSKIVHGRDRELQIRR